MRYAVVIDSAGTNFSAYLPDFPGCVATGKTLAQAEAAMVDAARFHLDGLRADDLPIPQPSTQVGYIDVTGCK